jgi:carbamate kinase
MHPIQTEALTSTSNGHRTHPIIVVAIGGNSLIPDNQHQDPRHQWDAVRETAAHIATMVQQGNTVLVTHGNGPQVGFNLRRNELAAHELHQNTLDMIVAETQGSIGYMLQQALNNEFYQRRLHRRAITMVTQVLVDRHDPAFQTPSKPVGSFLDEATAKAMEAEGWTVVEDDGRGWRRVVASPEPLAIWEEDAIRAAVESGWIVIAGGGGGIPVWRNDKGEARGVPAVIDKDRLSALFAINLRADVFVISTGVEKVAINFKQPNQQVLSRLTVADAQRYLADGQFPPGSMGPKIEACLKFVQSVKRPAIITNPPNLERALRGETGTWLVP